MQLFKSARQHFMWCCLLVVALVHVQCHSTAVEDLVRVTFNEMHLAYESLNFSSNDKVFIQNTLCFFNDVADLLLTYGSDYPTFTFQCYCFSHQIRSVIEEKWGDEIKSVQEVIDVFRQWILEYGSYHGWWQKGYGSLRSFTHYPRKIERHKGNNTAEADALVINQDDGTAATEDTKPERKLKALSWVQDHPLATTLGVCGGCALGYILIGKAFAHKQPKQQRLSVLTKDQSKDPLPETNVQTKENSVTGLSQKPPADDLDDDLQDNGKKKGEVTSLASDPLSNHSEKSGKVKPKESPQPSNSSGALGDPSSTSEVAEETPTTPTPLVQVQSIIPNALPSDSAIKESFTNSGRSEEHVQQVLEIRGNLIKLGRVEASTSKVSRVFQSLRVFSSEEQHDDVRERLYENLKLKLLYKNSIVSKKKAEGKGQSQGIGKEAPLLAVTANILNDPEKLRIQTTEVVIDFFGLVNNDTAALELNLNPRERNVLRDLLYQGVKTDLTSAGAIAKNLIEVAKDRMSKDKEKGWHNKDRHQQRLEAVFFPLMELDPEKIRELFNRLSNPFLQADDIINFFKKEREERNEFFAKNVADIHKEETKKQLDEAYKKLDLNQKEWVKLFKSLNQEEDPKPVFKEVGVLNLKEFFAKNLSLEDENSLKTNLELKRWAYNFVGRKILIPKLQEISVSDLNAPNMKSLLYEENIRLSRFVAEKIGAGAKRSFVEELCEKNKILDLFSYADFEKSKLQAVPYVQRIKDILSIREDKLIYLYCDQSSDERINILKLGNKMVIENHLMALEKQLKEQNGSEKQQKLGQSAS